MDFCDSIDWLVDILGTDVILEYITGTKVYIDERGNTNQEGLYFFKGHWVASTGGEIKNSMPDYQKSGTAHFCQSFAAMLYLGEAFEKESFASNIEKVISFWIEKLKDEHLMEMILDEIHTSHWVTEENRLVNVDNITGPGNVSLQDINADQLIRFLEHVRENAIHFVGCRQ